MVTATSIGLLALALAGCRTTGQEGSIWPPPDFRIEVPAFHVDDSGNHDTQNIRVWADGLVVYRESSGDLADAPMPIPVYPTVAIYRLDERSTRMLSRLLRRTGLYDQEGYVETVPDDRGQQVTLSWRAFARDGTLSTLSADVDTLERAIQVVNSFLPLGREVAWPGQLAGEREPRHVDEVPEPRDDLDGAVRAHETLARRFPDDTDLLMELFGVAVAADQRGPAEAALRTLESIEPTGRIEAEPAGEAALRELLELLWPLLPAGDEPRDDSR